MIEREPAFKWLMKNTLENLMSEVENPVLMDIGANVGDYTILMSKIMNGTPHRIIAIEPEPNVYDVLCKNIDFHGVNCICDGHAISDVTTNGFFHTAEKNNLGSLIYRPGVNEETIEISCCTIPRLLVMHGLEKVGFIKMDIEGGEVLALRGARDFLKNVEYPIKILMEVHPYLYTEELNLQTELEFLFDNGWGDGFAITAALPQHLRGYTDSTTILNFEVKRGWFRDIIHFDQQSDLMKYTCWPHEVGIPTWHGNLGKKLIRAILLEK